MTYRKTIPGIDGILDHVNTVAICPFCYVVLATKVVDCYALLQCVAMVAPASLPTYLSARRHTV
jgi:hypothetical protein